MILVTGLTGMVGNYLKTCLENKKLDYLGLSREELDLADFNSIDKVLKDKKFSHFIHLAAETNVDLCETDPEHAYKVNYHATKKIAEHCQQKGSRLIFISTSAVFGVQGKINYCELDTPAPVNLYGQSKLWAEQAIRQICQNYLIIRASWMIGGGIALDNKFVGKLISQLHAGKKQVSAVYDKFGSITNAKNLATFIVDSLDQSFTGIKHFSSYDFCSRYEIAKLLVNKLQPDCDVVPTRSSSFPLAAPRPLSEALYSAVPNEILPCTSYSWAEAVAAYIDGEFNDH